MLHIGMTSISLRGGRSSSHKSKREEEEEEERGGAERGAGVSAVQEHVRCQAAARALSSGRGSERVTHGERTTLNSPEVRQRTANFPPIQNYRQTHPHVIT